MLQQTRVETVKSYYKKFLQTFPTPQSLAEANEEEVVAVWQGLGYYSRARNLQAGVREWVENYGEKLPKERKDLEALRGIGPYTAGALLSIVHDLPEAAVDGNVFRVMTRFEALADEIDKNQTREKVSKLVLSMMVPEEPGNFNQALMELGATVCTPRSPSCGECPIQKNCVGFAQGTMLEYPKKKPARPPKPVQVFAGVLFFEGKVLLRQRPSKGLLASMWEFPAVEAKSEEEGLKELQAIFEEAGCLCKVEELICGVEHIFSHRIWDLRGYRIKSQKMPDRLPPEWKWHEWRKPEDILWAGPHRKIADYLFNE